MSTKKVILLSVLSSLLTLLVIVAVMAGGNLVLAQGPDVETGDGYAPNAEAPVFEVAPNAPDEAQQTFSYYYILGSHMQPRSSNTEYTYSGDGCIYVNSAIDNRMQFPVILPEGSQIKYVRIYYNDTSASTMTVWLTEYNAGQSADDLTSVSSTGSSGFGSTLSPQISEEVTGAVSQYTLNYSWGGVTNSTMQLCGIRVAYYAPIGGLSFLPSVLRD